MIILIQRQIKGDKLGGNKMMKQYKLKQWLPADKPKRIMVRVFASTEVLYEGIVYQIPHELMNRTVEFTGTYEDNTRIYIVSREDD